MIASFMSRLIAAGMSPVEAERKDALFVRALESLRQSDGEREAGVHAIWVPGRIEFLGKHTDYAGGRSLLCAIERGLCCVAAARSDRRVRIHDARTDELADFELSASLEPRAGHWSNYPMTVARRLDSNFPGALRGVDIAFSSDLPIAAGMSSSSALVVAVFLAFDAVSALAEQDAYRRRIHGADELAFYLGTVENGLNFPGLPGDRGVGTFGGSEDQTAILCARPDSLVQYSYCPVRFERCVKLPPGFTFVLGASGVVAEKTGSALEAYNALSRATRTLADMWCRAAGRAEGTLAEALAAGADAASLPRLLDELDGSCAHALRDRLDHFVVESGEIVPAAAAALERGDLAALGEIVDRSQRRAERLLGNQIPETIALARTARELGAVAASAFGAGFGGSVWALLPDRDAAAFMERWRDGYLSRFAEREPTAEFFITRAGPPALNIA